MNATDGLGQPRGRSFRSDVAVRAAFQVASALAGLAVLPLLLRAFDTDGFGIWSQITVTVTLFAPILTLRLEASIARYLGGKEDAKKRADAFFSVLATCTAVSLFVLAIGWLFRPMLAYVMFDDRALIPLAGLFLLRLGAHAAFTVATAYYRARSFIRLSTAYHALRSIGELLGLYVLLLAAGRGIFEAVLFIGLLDLFLAAAAIIDVVRRERTVSVSAASMGRFLRYSLPLIPAVAMYWVVNSSDRYVIVHLLDLDRAGIYSAAYGLSQVTKMIVLPLTFVLLPAASSMWERGRTQEAEDAIRRSTNWYLLFALPATAGLAAIGAPLLALMGTSRFAVDPLLIALLAVGELAVGVYQVQVFILYLREKTWVQPILFGGLALLNLGLNVLLVPRIGITGAALATLLSYGLQAYVVTAYAQRLTNRRQPWGIPIRACAASALVYLATAFLPWTTVAGLAVRITLGVLVYAVAAWALRLVRIDDVKALFRRECRLPRSGPVDEDRP
jgi:O-antigen/teichoic acid export membrane protein